MFSETIHNTVHLQCKATSQCSNGLVMGILVVHPKSTNKYVHYIKAVLLKWYQSLLPSLVALSPKIRNVLISLCSIENQHL